LVFTCGWAAFLGITITDISFPFLIINLLLIYRKFKNKKSAIEVIF
jgi:hypothetical protein